LSFLLSFVLSRFSPTKAFLLLLGVTLPALLAGTVLGCGKS
jgi:hypothetical protein